MVVGFRQYIKEDGDLLSDLLYQERIAIDEQNIPKFEMNNLFSGKFRENWERHQERFIKACQKWEIPVDYFIDYVPETLADDAFKNVESKRKDDENIRRINLSRLMTEHLSLIHI